MAILAFILLLFPFLGGLVLTNFGTTQSKARDTERKNDINTIYQRLEAHYNDYGEYPTEKELLDEYDTQLPGISEDALIDPSGAFIQEGDYTYKPSNCTAVGCQHYEIIGLLETEDPYKKRSLN